MIRLDGRGIVMISAVIVTRNLPETPKAKNQPVGWFL